MKIKQYKQDSIKKSKEAILGLVVFFFVIIFIIYTNKFPFVISVLEILLLFTMLLIFSIKIYKLPRFSFLRQLKIISLLDKMAILIIFMILIVILWGGAHRTNFEGMFILLTITVLVCTPKMITTYNFTRQQMEEAKKKRTLPGFDQSRWICTEIINKQSLEKISGARPNWLIKTLSGLYLAIPGAGLFLSRVLRKTVGDQTALDFVIGTSFWAFGFSLSELVAELAVFQTIRAWEKERGRPIGLDEA